VLFRSPYESVVNFCDEENVLFDCVPMPYVSVPEAEDDPDEPTDGIARITPLLSVENFATGLVTWFAREIVVWVQLDPFGQL
jgi:hypothetical protein